MPDFSLPTLPPEWVLFADWNDIAFGMLVFFLITLLGIWWRQQTRWWPFILTATFVLAVIMALISAYIFQISPHLVGCNPACNGWQGFPVPFVSVGFDGSQRVAPIDFALNLFILWLLWLVATMGWTLIFLAIQWRERSLRVQAAVVLAVFILPWALMPRYLNPPQPLLTGEDARLSINAQRTAQFTYQITGLWVHRLALEDIRELPSSLISALGQEEEPTAQVCLRGYTYFYIPWRRYRIILDSSGVVALNLTELPLSEPCW